MAASFKNGKVGHLKNPNRRWKKLMGLAHLTLEEAAEELGVKKERARQLFRIYDVERQSHRPKGVAKKNA